MSQSNMSQFDLEVPIQKSDRSEGWFITGIAAGSEVDLEGMSAHSVALQRMVDQINATHLPFYDWHNRNSSAAEMGEVIKAWKTENDQVGVEIELDQDHPTAQWLWKKLDQGKQFGLSIKGKTNNIKRELDAAGRSVAKYYDAFLEELSLTTKPIFTPSFGTVLKKAIDEELAESVEKGDKASMGEETPNAGVENQPADSGAAESATTKEETTSTETTTTTESSEPENETVDSAVEVEKAVSADTKRESNKLSKLVKFHAEMGALIKDLGLDGDSSEETSLASTAAEQVEVSKSQSSETEVLLRKALDEITALRADNEKLREQLPSVAVPPTLIQKSEMEQIAQAMAAMPTSDRLRFALAGIERNRR